MTRRDDSLRLMDMLQAANDAVSFAKGRKRSDLIEDKQLTLSLLKCVEIVGEAASRVTPETQESHTSLPWKDMIGMRNRLIHMYFDIDLRLLWSTVKNDLPVLIHELNQIIASNNSTKS